MHHLVSAQAHHESSLGLSQLSTSARGAKAKPKAGFQFNAEEQSVLVSGGASLPKKPHLDPKPDGHQDDRK